MSIFQCLGRKGYKYTLTLAVGHAYLAEQNRCHMCGRFLHAIIIKEHRHSTLHLYIADFVLAFTPTPKEVMFSAINSCKECFIELSGCISPRSTRDRARFLGAGRLPLPPLCEFVA